MKTREQNNSGGQNVVSEQSHGLTRVSKSRFSLTELLDLRSFKVGCVLPMVVVSILPQAEFGPNDHRVDVPHFI